MGLDVPLRWHPAVKCHHWAGGSRERGAAAGPGDKRRAALFWGLPQHPLLMTQLCPHGESGTGGRAASSLLVVRTLGLVEGRGGEGQRDSPVPRVARRAVPAGLSHRDTRAGRTPVARLSGSDGFLSPEQASPRDGLMAGQTRRS